ncbi:MAG: prolyl oligopeptidase family serine peptidase [Bradymonadaceae bacterium]
MPKKKPYGLWRSPLTPKSMAGDLSLREVGWACDGETIVWAESRSGQGVLCARRFDDAQWDITRELEVQGGVGEFTVYEDTVLFAAADGRLYRTSVDEGWPEPITPEYGSVASPTVSPDGEWVVFVHTDGETDVLAAVDPAGDKWPQKIAEGADFYMHPAWHPAGDRLAWVEWDHPNMPWDETRLQTADVSSAEGHLVVGEPEARAGGDATSVLQPEFSPDGGRLAYSSDADGWWHLYLQDLESGRASQLTEGEYEMAGPAWVQGIRSFAWAPGGEQVFAVRNDHGRMELVRIGVDGSQETVQAIDEYEVFRQPTISSTGRLATIGSATDTPPRVVTWAPGEEERIERRSSSERVTSEQLADIETLSWTVDHEGEEFEVYGNYYPPTNPEYTAAGDPPAIVMVHGGPTSQRTAEFEGRSQFFATRGFAVLDVNYRGSTGYGREYRDALKGNWGEADVADVVAGAEHLVDQGLADGDKLVVMGGSAGGYTVLQSLVEHPGFFAAGISMYGISNLFTLSMDTHKFEQFYNDSLVGALPEAAETFRERSPLFHAENIEDPVALFQGGEDTVVPREQADKIVESLERRGVPHEYHIYEDEGHGWRQPETIEEFYESTLDFLKQWVLFR